MEIQPWCILHYIMVYLYSWKCVNYSSIICLVVVLVITTSKMCCFSKLNIAANNYQEDIAVAVVIVQYNLSHAVSP